nr:LysR family transcriptional regulator [Pseudomonas sp.]
MPAEPYTESPAHLVARLRFRHLKLLVELHKGGSLRATASVLNLTQPALSKALGEIESAFGFPLFVRSARGLRVTPRGEIAVRGAALLLQELAHVHAEASATPPSTVLRLGAPPFVAHGYLPPVLLRLAQLPARVRVQLFEDRVPPLLDELLEGRLDALITTYPAQLPESAGQVLQYENLFDADFAVVAPAGHRLARSRQVDWQQLATEDWVMPARSSMARRMIEDMFIREGVRVPEPLVESTSPVTNVRLVAAGLGLGIVPRAVLDTGAGAQTVEKLQVRPPLSQTPVALVYRRAMRDERIELLRAALQLAPAHA